MKDVTASAPTMTTDMSPAIATPDRVETRLGTLNFKDGVPDTLTGLQPMARLERFREAQNSSYAGFAAALDEVQRGRKTGHWIW